MHLYADFCINLQLYLHKVTCVPLPCATQAGVCGPPLGMGESHIPHTHTLENQPRLAPSYGRCHAVWRRGRHGMGHGSRGSNSFCLTPLNLLHFRKWLHLLVTLLPEGQMRMNHTHPIKQPAGEADPKQKLPRHWLFFCRNSKEMNPMWS